MEKIVLMKIFGLELDFENLSKLDWVQIGFLGLTIVVGVLPSFLPIKMKKQKEISKNGKKKTSTKLTGYGVIFLIGFIFFLFGSLLVSALNIHKVNKEANTSKEKTESLLTSAKNTINQSNSIYQAVDESKDSLSTSINLLKQLNIATGLLTNNIKIQKRNLRISDSTSFELSLNTIASQFIVGSIGDSLIVLQKYRNFIDKVSQLMASIYKNEYFLENKDLVRLFSVCSQKLREIDLMLNGYALNNMRELFSKVNDLLHSFRRIYDVYSEEIGSREKVLKDLHLR